MMTSDFLLCLHPTSFHTGSPRTSRLHGTELVECRQVHSRTTQSTRYYRRGSVGMTCTSDTVKDFSAGETNEEMGRQEEIW